MGRADCQTLQEVQQRYRITKQWWRLTRQGYQPGTTEEHVEENTGGGNGKVTCRDDLRGNEAEGSKQGIVAGLMFLE